MQLNKTYVGLNKTVNVKIKIIVHLNHKSITTSLNHWETQTERGMVNDCMHDTIIHIQDALSAELQVTTSANPFHS